MIELFSSINPFASLPPPAISSALQEGDIQIEADNSFTVVDEIRNVLSSPIKLLIWNSRYNSGNVSSDTLAKVRTYLHENGLHHVSVYVNSYKPLEVWHKVFSNPRTSKLSKWTLGLLEAGCETLVFSKLTGYQGDHFNPMANTVHLFSDDWVIALQTCARAKDYHLRRNPSLYRMLGYFGVVGTASFAIQEYKATTNLLHYLRQKNASSEAIQDVWKTLIPLQAMVGAICVFTRTEEQLKIYQAKSIPDLIFAVTVITTCGHLIARTLALLDSSNRNNRRAALD